MRKILPAVVVALVLALPGGVAAQGGDKTYELPLPQGWQETSYVDGAQIKRVEYVYGDRSQAMLKVKHTRVRRGESLDMVVDRELGSLRFQPGFVQGRTEGFGGGALSGTLVEYDFNRGGKPMLGRSYVLAGDDSTVWVLQFTGDRTMLKSLRNVTDQMARSFREK